MLLGLLLAAASLASPCITASPECTEWVKLAGQTSRLLVYRSHSLASKNENIARAFVFVHGINRDADNHFRTALAAAFLAGALNDTAIVVPRFASSSAAAGNQAGNCGDALAPGEANWVCDPASPNSWKSGGGEVGNEKMTSFDFMDEIVRRLARKDVFPNLKTIVVAGHSAGGQFLIRYEMTNQVHDAVDVPLSYVVSNPSSFAYVDNLRPTASALPSNLSAATPGYHPPMAAAPPPAFIPFADAKNCTGYNSWPYGLQGRSGYGARLTDDQLKSQLTARPVTYLLGEADILPLGLFDVSCPATAQGPTRLGRGVAFNKYVDEHLGAHHQVIVVPYCGHSARCMFTSDVALPVIFPTR